MTLKLKWITICLLTFITTGCGTLNNGSFFSQRQGKNKVIQRDFEAIDYVDKTDQLAALPEQKRSDQPQEIDVISEKPELSENSAPEAIENTEVPMLSNIDEVHSIATDPTPVRIDTQETTTPITSNEPKTSTILVVILLVFLSLLLLGLLATILVIAIILSWF